MRDARAAAQSRALRTRVERSKRDASGLVEALVQLAHGQHVADLQAGIAA
jgi:hypothetical protein